MPPQRTALVTGVAGQDGVYVARLLLRQGYRVVGAARPGSGSAVQMESYLRNVQLVDLDVRDSARFAQLLDQWQPDEVYNLASFSSVGASWQHPDLVAAVNGDAVVGMLDVIRRRDRRPRFFQASSAEVFGAAAPNPQQEDTAHDPGNPYAVAKSHAHRAAVRYREEFGLHCVVGILYNHESPLRGRQFVTRKIVRAAAEIAASRHNHVELGNLAVARDWGSAEDYAVAMTRALQHDDPADYVIATGQSHSLEDLLVTAFDAAGLGDPWPYVRQNPALLRPADDSGRVGDASRALARLGWSPAKTFEDVVARMVAVDARRIRTGIEEAEGYA